MDLIPNPPIVFWLMLMRRGGGDLHSPPQCHTPKPITEEFKTLKSDLFHAPLPLEVSEYCSNSGSNSKMTNANDYMINAGNAKFFFCAVDHEN